MFTGLVEGVGTIAAARLLPGGSRRITVKTPLDLARLPIGASIAIDGVCLTVVARRGRQFAADIGPETLARTTLGERVAGARVHVERPLRIGDPLGGHMVAGHVDGVGRLQQRRALGDALELRVAIPAALARFVAPKGSIAVDGVSLTVNTVRGRIFTVTLIPHTLAATCLGERQAGDRVNIETDLVAKHVAALMRKP